MSYVYLLLAILIRSSELNHTNNPLGQIPRGVARWLGDLYFLNLMISEPAYIVDIYPR